MGANKRILILGDVNLESRALATEAQAQGLSVRFELIRGHMSSLQNRTSELCDFIIIKDHVIGSNFVNDFQLLGQPDKQPVLLIVDSMDEKLIQQVRKSKAVRCLFAPLFEDALAKYIVQSFAKGLPVQQGAKRFSTDLHIEVEKFGSGFSANAELLNLSRFGARFGLDVAKSDFKKGDLIQLTVQLQELQREHIVNGEVVWTQPAEVGVSFVNPNDLLKKMMQSSAA